jgi:hypothetical protein
LGETAGECNVLNRPLAESSAIHFVRSILDIRISFGRACPIITSELLVPNISAKKVSSEIRSSGEARAADILGRYQARRFANVACHAGTVQRLHTLSTHRQNVVALFEFWTAPRYIVGQRPTSSETTTNPRTTPFSRTERKI